MPKRVWNLYRVSTKAQLTKDEIPTQQKECHSFINKQKDWVLTREVSEPGVSAFKNKAIDREILNEILRGAINKEFDILLIYKADRLGRLFMDTPTYLSNLYQYGIETYSTVENYLDVSTHNGRLMVSFIIWQAEGESRNTSQRVTDFMLQYNEEGKFMGGTAPYGYKVIKTGNPHWKHKDKVEKKLIVDEDESVLVKEIFSLAYEKGFGSVRIAHYFNSPKRNAKTRSGGIWRSNVINRILRNPIYIGQKQYNTMNKDKTLKDREEFRLQPKNEEWVIIDENVFWSVQDRIKENTTSISNEYKSSPTSSKLLLAGIARCGYCGGKLKADYSVKTYTRKSNNQVTKMKTSRYICMNARESKENHPTKYFAAKKFEEAVIEQLYAEIKHLDMGKVSEKTKGLIDRDLKTLTMSMESNKTERAKITKEISALKDEVTKVILGESNFDSKMLQELITNKENRLIELNNADREIQKEIEKVSTEDRNAKDTLEIFEKFQDKFPVADVPSKKMMLSSIIEEILLFQDEVKIQLNLRQVI